MKKTKHSTLRQTAALLFLSFLLTGQVYALDLQTASLLTDKVEELVPVGESTGIKLKSDGVIVVGLTEVNGTDGTASPAQAAGLKKGDIIEQIDGVKLHAGTELVKLVEDSGGKTMAFHVKRGESVLRLEVTPMKAQEGGYKVGILVRDSLMGIGTITFYEPKSGVYGALGHGISDPDSDSLIPIADGTLIPSDVTDVTKGEAGTPGELHGAFEADEKSGTVEKNADTGIYGHLCGTDLCNGKEALPICKSGDIKTGDAQILSTVCKGDAKHYDIKILKITEGGGKDHKDMLIQVTDPDLLAITGGIVQGMSGSPIIQDGKLVGAVTHVLVNDPTRGYGIFIENMLEAAG